MNRYFLIAAGLTLSMIAPASVQAAEPKLVATHNSWMVYTNGTGKNQICYAMAKPNSKSPKAVKHGDVYFMVANWKSGAAKEQPSLMTGYAFKVTSPPFARIGSTKIPMYVAQNEAFIESRSNEARLVKNMRAGSLMRVQAVSERGTATSYEFSLKGVTAALKKAKSLCN